MSKYLLIEFDDDAQADALRAQIDAATAKGKKFRVVGLFARPRRWCSCYVVKTNMRDRLVRGKKFGWWTCVECKRPRLGDHQPNNLIEGAGMDTSPTVMGIDQFSILPQALDYVIKPTTLSISVYPKR